MRVERNDSGKSAPVRSDWTRVKAEALYGLWFADLMCQAQSVRRDNFDLNHVDTASLFSIKAGASREGRGYCSQSTHYDTWLKASRLAYRADVFAAAQRANGAGATQLLYDPTGAIRQTAISIRSAT
ncbi:hypothetical protein [Bradyrhizobium neotropicale]|uniref:hypothetical protein n=1 Tax=Bradyrhizobium neotropicale TaxID=1497615 RepID=UPI001AD67EE1|nr:hypothetical protein [Bradyrhizobium neotropicale]MBO4227510.1 hypothetical protein [Bradyrhizobium neotropicale]